MNLNEEICSLRLFSFQLSSTCLASNLGLFQRGFNRKAARRLRAVLSTPQLKSLPDRLGGPSRECIMMLNRERIGAAIFIGALLKRLKCGSTVICRPSYYYPLVGQSSFPVRKAHILGYRGNVPTMPWEPREHLILTLVSRSCAFRRARVQFIRDGPCLSSVRCLFTIIVLSIIFRSANILLQILDISLSDHPAKVGRIRIVVAVLDSWRTLLQ